MSIYSVSTWDRQLDKLYYHEARVERMKKVLLAILICLVFASIVQTSASNTEFEDSDALLQSTAANVSRNVGSWPKLVGPFIMGALGTILTMVGLVVLFMHFYFWSAFCVIVGILTVAVSMCLYIRLGGIL